MAGYFEEVHAVRLEFLPQKSITNSGYGIV
jgi:hypothetical protein